MRFDWAPFATVGLFLWGYGVGYYTAVEECEDSESGVETSKVTNTVIVGSNMRELVDCEFDKPIKHITLINHWYTSHDELNADYILLAEPNDVEEVWGWSNCVWQPADDWAACDVYAMLPEFVHADMNMDTVGHEVVHGACGDFHQ